MNKKATKKKPAKPKAETPEQETMPAVETTDAAAEAMAPAGEPPAHEPPVTEVTAAEPPPGQSLQAELADKLKWIEELREQEAECKAAEVEHERAKKEAKEAKEHYDSTVLKLRRMINQAAEDSPGPLYAKPKQQPAASTAPAADDDAWKATPMADLQRYERDGKQLLSDSVIDKLREGGIETVGQYCDHLAADKWITDVAGIGQETATKIENAMEDFWAERKALAEAAVPLNPSAETLAAFDAAVPAPDWRAARIGDLIESGYGFAATDLEPLAAANITTAGQLDEFLQEHSIDDLALKEERRLVVLNALQQFKDDSEDLAAGSELEEELAGAEE